MGGGLSVGVRILIGRGQYKRRGGNAYKCKQGINTMETVGKGGCGYQRWHKNTHAELICSQNQGLRTE